MILMSFILLLSLLVLLHGSELELLLTQRKKACKIVRNTWLGYLLLFYLMCILVCCTYSYFFEP